MLCNNGTHHFFQDTIDGCLPDDILPVILVTSFWFASFGFGWWRNTLLNHTMNQKRIISFKNLETLLLLNCKNTSPNNFNFVIQTWKNLFFLEFRSENKMFVIYVSTLDYQKNCRATFINLSTQLFSKATYTLIWHYKSSKDNLLNRPSHRIQEPIPTKCI